MLEIVDPTFKIKYNGQELVLKSPGLGALDVYYKKLKKCKTDADQVGIAAELGKKMGLTDESLEWMSIETLTKVIQEAQKVKKN